MKLTDLITVNDPIELDDQEVAEVIDRLEEALAPVQDLFVEIATNTLREEGFSDFQVESPM